MREWHILSVEELAAPTKAAIATGPFGSAIGSKTFRETGVPVIRGGNLRSETGVRLEDDGLVFVDEELAEKFSRSVAQKGDLIFTCWGTIDQVGLVDDRAKYDRYIVSNKQMKFRPDEERMLALFAYYFFCSPEGKAKMADKAIGSSVPGFNLTGLKSISLPVPPIAEQHRIVDLLGALDDKIELNRRMNETLESTARTIFKDWFVDFGPTRAKAEGRAPYLAREIWDLFPDALDDDDRPVGWELRPAHQLFEFNPRERIRKGAEAPYLDMASLPTNGLVADTPTCREYKSGTKFRDGDTLFARITPCLENGKTAYAFGFGEDVVAAGSTEFIVIRSINPLPRPVSYLLARDPEFRRHAERSMTGTSGRQRANTEALMRYELAAPPNHALWGALDHFIKPMIARVIANAYEARTLAQTRDLLLPKLMSGEICLREAEKAVEDVA